MKSTSSFFLLPLLLCLCLLLPGCGKGEDQRGRLDTTSIPVVEIQQEALEVKRTFSSEKSSSTQTFTFSSASDVQSFRYCAYYTGTYTFTATCGLSVYVHGGNLVTDWFEAVPCTYDLKANYEYTIEVKLNDAACVDQPVTLTVTTPNISEQSITGCRSFEDTWTGEDEYYTFVAPRAGKYSFTIEGVGEMEIISNGKVIATTGWDTWSKEFPKDGKITIHIKYMQSKSTTKVLGSITYPPEVIDITDVLEENPCVVLKYKPQHEEQDLVLEFTLPQTKKLLFSNTDVGVQWFVEGGLFGSDQKQYRCTEGYGILNCRIGERELSGDYIMTATAKEKYTISIKTEADGKEYYLTVFSPDAVKTYLPYED